MLCKSGAFYTPKEITADFFEFWAKTSRLYGAGFLLSVIFQMFAYGFNCGGEDFFLRQADNSEMVRGLPVKAAARHNENFPVPKEVYGKLPVILDFVYRAVNFRKKIEGRLCHLAAEAGNFVKKAAGSAHLAANSSPFKEIFLNPSPSLKAGCNNSLPRNI